MRWAGLSISNVLFTWGNKLLLLLLLMLSSHLLGSHVVGCLKLAHRNHQDIETHFISLGSLLWIKKPQKCGFLSAFWYKCKSAQWQRHIREAVAMWKFAMWRTQVGAINVHTIPYQCAYQPILQHQARLYHRRVIVAKKKKWSLREPLRKKIRDYLGVFPNRGWRGSPQSQNFCDLTK